jgi:pyruvate dehydrogenase E2 component (dihydrolipoamide acetyltransferase)
MLRAINASSAPVSAAPNPVREAPAVDLQLVAAAPAPVAAEPVASAPGASGGVVALRYNSTEFVYRQDIGRIVLIGQSPETGERTIQIPSEEALRAYERTMRAEERANLLVKQPAPQSEKVLVPAAGTPLATPAPLPSLPQAVTAVLSANQNSAVVSVSA